MDQVVVLIGWGGRQETRVDNGAGTVRHREVHGGTGKYMEVQRSFAGK